MMLIFKYLLICCLLQHSADSIPSRLKRDTDTSDSDEHEEGNFSGSEVANNSCSFPSPRINAEKAYAVKECQQLKHIDWKEAYRKCCQRQQRYDSVCGSRRDGTYGTMYYNECSLYRDRITNPNKCIIRRPYYHKDCQRCAMKQSEPPPCDLDLQSYDKICTSDLFDLDDYSEDRCMVPRCMSESDKITTAKECQKLKLIDWKEALRQCCRQRKGYQMVCGSRNNGTMGTYYYNQCALIRDRYLHPNECILDRRWEHNDCKRCGRNLMKVPECWEETGKDIDAGPTTTQPPAPSPKSMSTKGFPLRRGCSDARQQSSNSNGKIYNDSDDEDDDDDSDEDNDVENDNEEDQKCSKLQNTNWENELIGCCQQQKGPQKVCGSRRNGTHGTFYYNECALIQARYLHPGECILKRIGDHDDCKVCDKNEEEPPKCPAICDLKTHTSYHEVPKLYIRPCFRQPASFYCQYCSLPNKIPQPPKLPWKDCPLPIFRSIK